MGRLLVLTTNLGPVQDLGAVPPADLFRPRANWPTGPDQCGLTLHNSPSATHIPWPYCWDLSDSWCGGNSSSVPRDLSNNRRWPLDLQLVRKVEGPLYSCRWWEREWYHVSTRQDKHHNMTHPRVLAGIKSCHHVQDKAPLFSFTQEHWARIWSRPESPKVWHSWITKTDNCRFSLEDITRRPSQNLKRSHCIEGGSFRA